MTPTRIAKHVFAEFINLSSMLNSICWLLTISGRTSRAIAGFLRPLGNQANPGFACTLQTANTFLRSADCVQRSPIAFDRCIVAAQAVPQPNDLVNVLWVFAHPIAR